MNKILVLAGFIVSTLCISQFTSCSDEEDDDQIKNLVDSTDSLPNDSLGILPVDSVDSLQTDSVSQFIDTMTVSGKIGDYDYVDLGLKSGLKWATYNIGATKIFEYGDYFTWGSTNANSLGSAYVQFYVSDPQWGYGELSITKYNSDSAYTYESGVIDNKTVLEPSDDAAAVIWGKSWRMPTKEELEELIDGCTWVWVDNYGGSGISGLMGTSKTNGNTILLHAAGCYYNTGGYYHMDSSFIPDTYGGDGTFAFYWSSSLDKEDSINAWGYLMRKSSAFEITYRPRDYKQSGQSYAYSVRAVSE